MPAALILVALVIGTPDRYTPPGLDQGILAYIGSDVLDGRVPYAENWDHKPPGAYFLYAFGFALFGRSVEAIRALDLLYMCCLALTLYALGARLFNRVAGFGAGVVLLVTYYTRLEWWDQSQPDGYMLLPALGALVLIATPPERRALGHELGAGACLGFAFITKFVALFVCFPLAFALATEYVARREPRALGRALLGLAAGFIVVIAGLALYLAHGHALPNFIESQAVFNRGYVLRAHRGDPDTILDAKDMFQPRVALPLAYLALVAWCLPIRSLVAFRTQLGLSGKSYLMVLLLLAGIAGEIIAQAKFYPYHFTPLLVPLGLFAGAGASLVYGAVARLVEHQPRAFRALPVLVVAALLAVTIVPFGHLWRDRYRTFRALQAGRKDPETFYHEFGGYADGGGFSYLASYRVARWIREHSKSSDRIYVWGFDPLLAFLAERKHVSRFTYNTPLIVEWRRSEWRREFMAALEATPPKFFLVLHHDQHHWTTGRYEDSYELFMRDFPELRHFVGTRYRRRKVIEDYEIFVRKK